MATGRIPTTANSPLTVKGDLFGYSTTQARVPVGNDGETLVADSSTSTGLRYQANFAAGKNKIINGDFGVWQRGTSFSSPANGSFLADRYFVAFDGTPTVTYSRQTFTPGAAPVAGYEGQFFFRAAMTATSTTTSWNLYQKIENVQTFAGQTITVSFWAKADSARSVAMNFLQEFGSGGSGAVFGGAGQINSVTTSWQRFSYTLTLPSISGKTIGTGSSLTLYITLPISSTSTIDLWGVQVEAGSVATAFQTATGTIQGELAACQRYYYRATPSTAASGFGGLSETGIGVNSTKVRCQVRLPVTMRAAPTSVDFSTICVFDTATTIAVTAVSLLYETFNHGSIELTVASGVTQFRPYTINGNASTSAYLGFNAEL